MRLYCVVAIRISELRSIVIALGQLVELGALLHGHESGDAQLGAGLLHGGGPLAQAGVLVSLLAQLVLLLADNLPRLVLHEILLGQAALGPVGGAAPDAPHASVDDLAPLGLTGPAGGPLAGAPAAAGRAARRAAAGPLGCTGPAAGAALALARAALLGRGLAVEGHAALGRLR